MYFNKAIIIGNLTRDPEQRSLPSGMAVTSFSIATNRVWKDKEGNKQESVDFHNIVVFGRQAETTAQYLKKGSMAMVEGRIQTRSWDGQDGTKKYRTEIVADRVQFGPRNTSAGNKGNNEFGNQPANSASETGGGTQEKGNQETKENIETIQYPEEEIKPEDIPF